MKGGKKVKLMAPRMEAHANGVIVSKEVAVELERQKEMETSDYTQEEKDKFEELTRAINSFNLKFIKGKQLYKQKKLKERKISEIQSLADWFEEKGNFFIILDKDDDLGWGFSLKKDREDLLKEMIEETEGLKEACSELAKAAGIDMKFTINDKGISFESKEKEKEEELDSFENEKEKIETFILHMKKEGNGSVNILDVNHETTTLVCETKESLIKTREYIASTFLTKKSIWQKGLNITFKHSSVDNDKLSECFERASQTIRCKADLKFEPVNYSDESRRIAGPTAAKVEPVLYSGESSGYALERERREAEIAEELRRREAENAERLKRQEATRKTARVARRAEEPYEDPFQGMEIDGLLSEYKTPEKKVILGPEVYGTVLYEQDAYRGSTKLEKPSDDFIKIEKQEKSKGKKKKKSIKQKMTLDELANLVEVTKISDVNNASSSSSSVAPLRKSSFDPNAASFDPNAASFDPNLMAGDSYTMGYQMYISSSSQSSHWQDPFAIPEQWRPKF